MMRSHRRSVGFLALVLALSALSAPHLLQAKGTPTYVAITGSGLPNSIEVRDPLVLENLDMISLMNIWKPIAEPAKRGLGVEITRYGGKPGALQADDRLHYFPNPTGGLGFVRYDGLINGGSEFDNKWFQANVCGDRTMRRLLAGQGASTSSGLLGSITIFGGANLVVLILAMLITGGLGLIAGTRLSNVRRNRSGADRALET